MPSPTLRTPDAAVRAAITPEGPSAMARPAHAAVENAAGRIRSEMQTNGVRSATEMMASTAPPIDHRQVGETFDDNFGRVNPATGARERNAGSSEASRLKDANEVHALVKQLSERGYNTLSNTQKTTLRKAMEDAIRRLPGGPELLADLGLTPRELEAALDKRLAGKDYAIEVQKLFAQKTGSDAKIDGTADEAAMKELEQAEAKHAAAERAHDAKNDELDRAIKVAEQFQVDSAGRPVTGAYKERQLQTLLVRRGTIEADKTKAEQELAGKDLERKRLTRAYESAANGYGKDKAEALRLEGELSRIDTEIAGLGRKVTDAQRELDRITELEAEKAQAFSEKARLEREEADAKDALSLAEREKLRAKASFTQAALRRSDAEDAYVDSLEAIFGRAAETHLTERLAAAEAAQQRAIEAAAADDSVERMVAEAIKSRWDLRDGKFLKSEIENDWNLLMNPNSGYGPEGLMRNILQRRGLAPSEIDEKLRDKAFMEKMQPIVVEKLMTRRIQTGKITKEQARMITESEWGKGMIEKAINNKAEIRNAISQLKAEGILKGGPMDWLKNASDGNILKFLLLFLPAFAIVAPKEWLSGVIKSE